MSRPPSVRAESHTKPSVRTLEKTAGDVGLSYKAPCSIATLGFHEPARTGWGCKLLLTVET